jgi:hypothetical protein
MAALPGVSREARIEKTSATPARSFLESVVPASPARTEQRIEADVPANVLSSVKFERAPPAESRSRGRRRGAKDGQGAEAVAGAPSRTADRADRVRPAATGRR